MYERRLRPTPQRGHTLGYHAAETLADALTALGQATDARIVAGGTDLFPALGELPAPADLVDVSRVAEMRGIERHGAGWRIGGAATWSDVMRAALPAGFDGLKAAAREVGSVQIQNAGTVAGNLCNASPAADGVPPLLALNATVELSSVSGVRQMALADFLLGVRKTALAPAELLTAIHVPDLPEGAGASFVKLGSRRYLVISIVMVSAVVVMDGPRIAQARIAVGAASPVAQRLPLLEAALVGCRPGALPVITPEHLASLSPIDDVRGTAGYRMAAVAELIDRAVRRAADG